MAEWDHSYRRLDEGEIVCRGDEVQADDGSWDLAVRSIGKPAPNPSYTSHRVFRRRNTYRENSNHAQG